MVGSIDMVGPFEPVQIFDMAGRYELIREFEPVG